MPPQEDMWVKNMGVLLKWIKIENEREKGGIRNVNKLKPRGETKIWNERGYDILNGT